MSEKGNDYSRAHDLPDLVMRAAALIDRFDFRNSCALVYGPMLQALAAQVRGGVIGEMGTGVGIGVAWMLTTLSIDSRIVTIDIDAERSAAVKDLYSDELRVTVVHGDALAIAEYGPFDLLYCDAGPGKTSDEDVTISMMRPGGLIVLDDLTPGGTNGVRSFWLRSPDVHAFEVAVSPDLAVILAVRR